MSETQTESAAQARAARSNAVVASGITVGELRRIRRALVTIMLLALFTAVHFTRDPLLPIILTLTLLPVIHVGDRYGVPTGVTAVTVILAMALGFTGLGYGFSGPAQTMTADAPRIAEEVQDKLGRVLDRFASLRRTADEVAGGAAPDAGTLIDADGDGVSTTPVVTVVEDDEPHLADQVVSGLASTGGALSVALVLTVFLLAGGDFYHRRTVEAAPRLRDKKQA